MDEETGPWKSESLLAPLASSRPTGDPSVLSPAFLFTVPYWVACVGWCPSGRSCKPMRGSMEHRREDSSPHCCMVQGSFLGANPPCLDSQENSLHGKALLPENTQSTVIGINWLLFSVRLLWSASLTLVNMQCFLTKILTCPILHLNKGTFENI